GFKVLCELQKKLHFFCRKLNTRNWGRHTRTNTGANAGRPIRKNEKGYFIYPSKHGKFRTGTEWHPSPSRRRIRAPAESVFPPSMAVRAGVRGKEKAGEFPRLFLASKYSQQCD